MRYHTRYKNMENAVRDFYSVSNALEGFAGRLGKVQSTLSSVVILKEGEKTIMIYGRKQIHAESGEEFDYVACLYPEGNISDEFTYLFNHDQIDQVIHTGYSNDEDLEFVKEFLSD